jgi:hypothetical protein
MLTFHATNYYSSEVVVDRIVEEVEDRAVVYW